MVLFVWAKLGDILIDYAFYRLINWVWDVGEKGYFCTIDSLSKIFGSFNSTKVR